MEVAACIQTARKAAGLTQAELAEKMGVSRQAVTKWENGKAIPEPEKLLKLSRLFGVTIESLLGVHPPEQQT